MSFPNMSFPKHVLSAFYLRQSLSSAWEFTKQAKAIWSVNSTSSQIKDVYHHTWRFSASLGDWTQVLGLTVSQAD